MRWSCRWFWKGGIFVRRIFNLTNALFLAHWYLNLSRPKEGVNAWYYIGLVLVLEVFYILNVLIKKMMRNFKPSGCYSHCVWDSDSMGDFYNKNGFGRQASFPLTFFCSWVINIGTSGIFERNFELFSAAVCRILSGFGSGNSVRLGYWLEEKALQGCKSTYKSLGTDTSHSVYSLCHCHTSHV